MTGGGRILARRLAAFAIDCGLLFLVLAPIGYGVQWALGVRPATPREIWIVLVLNFSLPVWTYFAASDASPGGATLGKRWFGLRARDIDGGGIPPARALGRTALKLLPWEATHASAFLFPSSMGAFGPASWVGLAVAYALAFAYLGVAWRSGGRRSVHDLVVSTRVDPAR